MKFRIKVLGKDSISEGVAKPSVAAVKAKGIKWDKADNGDAWDTAIDAEHERLRRFVEQFVIDGSGGNDGVTVEFDTEAGTCVVVPQVKKPKPY